MLTGLRLGYALLFPAADRSCTGRGEELRNVLGGNGIPRAEAVRDRGEWSALAVRCALALAQRPTLTPP